MTHTHCDKIDIRQICRHLFSNSMKIWQNVNEAFGVTVYLFWKLQLLLLLLTSPSYCFQQDEHKTNTNICCGLQCREFNFAVILVIINSMVELQMSWLTAQAMGFSSLQFTVFFRYNRKKSLPPKFELKMVSGDLRNTQNIRWKNQSINYENSQYVSCNPDKTTHYCAIFISAT